MGPLAGLKVIEMAGMGPGPFAAMLLADLGAEVVRVDRWSAAGDLPETETRVRSTSPRSYVLHRGRRSVGVDLKTEAGKQVVLRLCAQADALIEGFRPGVMERLGLGPAACRELNPRLVYGRMTGWGQDGPLAQRAGHDINYIAMSGLLNSCKRVGERPLPPVNFVGDFGGGGLMLALGVVSACWEAARSGQGQVVDAAIVDGSAVLTSMLYGLMAQGRWVDEPGTNFVDTGSPYYEVYETSDGRFLSVGAIEPRFYRELLLGLGLDQDPIMQNQDDRAAWPAMKRRVAEVVATRTRDEWERVFEGTDACVAPVLSITEAAMHPANIAREVFFEADGIVQPSPAPRFSRSTASSERLPPEPGEHSAQVLRDWGVTEEEIDGWLKAAAVGPA
ncbi:CaiB/BaiF CoA transferase family protein [Phytohabitans suffuscus]|uniref:CoA transferase n=1 Tax=Phytohabitans suffuscus TaxID=624315 RepID=A0A6F8YR78_9ACTN|nr:CaiB/BaiF CoA-transferase family protein [Phytohabitans suffuscus]BCB88604.1 CoA transferase [Phytohabitans suffuscus]